MITDTNDANSEIVALKNQLFTLLIALIVVSGTLTVYLFRQTSLTGKDLVQARQIQTSMLQRDAAITGFVNQLVAFGAKHPDFVPVLKKYGIVPGPGGQAMPAK